MSVGIYFSGLYVKIYKIKSARVVAERGDICFPPKTPSSLYSTAARCFERSRNTQKF